MHGGVVADFVGQTGTFVLAPGAQAELPELIKRLGHEGQLWITHDHARLDGSVFPAETEVITTVDRDGRPLYRMSWCEDLTQQRAAEAAHRKTGAMFEAAFAYAPNGVAMIGLDGRFLRATRRCAPCSGAARPSSSGTRPSRSATRMTSTQRNVRTRP